MLKEFRNRIASKLGTNLYLEMNDKEDKYKHTKN
jgi:hypothetical protein